MEQNMMRESHERDLGESASVGQHESMASEIEKLRMEQMMRQLALPPQMQPAAQSEEHMALMKMQEEMASLRRQNMQLQQQVTSQMSAQVARMSGRQYSHDDLQQYFEHKRRSNSDMLKKRVEAEKVRLQRLTAQMNDAEAQEAATAATGNSLSLVQLSEGAEDSPMPVYNQRAEEARVESEELKRRALEDALASQHFGE